MTRVAVVDAGAGARGAATENESVGDGSNLTTSPSHQPAPGETSGRDADAAVEPEVHSGEESESVPPLGYASSDDASTAEPDLGDDSDDASLQPLADDGLVSLAPTTLRSQANAPDPGFENSRPPRPHHLGNLTSYVDAFQWLRPVEGPVRINPAQLYPGWWWPPQYGWGIRTDLTYPETRQPPPEERREDDADQP